MSQTEITKATRDLTPEAAKVVADVVHRITIDIEAAERALCAAEEADELIESTNASLKLIAAIRANVDREWAHFREVLGIAVKVATEINKPIIAAPVEPNGYQTVESVPPHQYGLRDLICVALEMQVIGKIIARGPIIAVCELTDGCWLSQSTELLFRKLPSGTKFLCLTDMIPIMPYSVHHTNNIGYILPTSEIINEDIIGHHQSFEAEMSKMASGQVWRDPKNRYWPKYKLIEKCEFKWGKGVYYSGDGYDHHQYVSEPSAGYAGYLDQYASTWSRLSAITWPLKDSMKPKYKVLRYERSYRVLVAAPWDFDLDALKARVASGEQLNLRDEIERVIIGHEAPNIHVWSWCWI